MELGFAQIDWVAVVLCVIAGQVWLTLWFVVLFGEPWARAYGGEGMTKAQHTKEVPMYTYGIGAACVLALSVGLSLLQTAAGVTGVVGALQLGVLLAVTVFVPMAMPAYAFLRRWDAFVIGAGSQVTLICILSAILGAWR